MSPLQYQEKYGMFLETLRFLHKMKNNRLVDVATHQKLNEFFLFVRILY